jgi:CspA family cold shock protein
MTRISGTVKFFDNSRGFGFICPSDGGPEVFVHRSDLQESCRVDGELRLCPDDLVEFDIVDAGRGPRAVAISKEVCDAPTS